MSSNIDLVECPKCNVRINPMNLSKHLNKVHGVQSEVSKIRAELMDRLKRRIDDGFISCHVCKCKLKSKRLKSHCKSVHGIDLESFYKRKENNKIGKYSNRFKSEREKEAFWRKMFGPDSEDSQDIFEKRIFLNGGAYGLGKNRKH